MDYAKLHDLTVLETYIDRAYSAKTDNRPSFQQMIKDSYYACTRQKKHECDKKMIAKEPIENFVVTKTMEFLCDDEIINKLANTLYKLQFKESALLPQLEKELEEKNKEIENIVNAVQKGYAADTIIIVFLITFGKLHSNSNKKERT